MKYAYRILNQLNRYAGAEKSFHMPGHKGRGDFESNFPIAPLDVTELAYSDNLVRPTGVIAEAQRDIAEILGAEKSYILTDGSTCGVLAMVYAASRKGKKLIVPRNCHSSVWNGCLLFGIEPVTLRGNFKDGVLLLPDPKEVEELLSRDRDIAGMLVIHPDYYGNFAPLAEYSAALKKYGKFLFADGAHGAHLAFEPKRRGHAGGFADMWVDGAHKSLPTLTQGSVLSVKESSLVADAEEGLALVRTTSPSYPVMASVEYGIKFYANNPEIYIDAKAAAERFRRECGLKFYSSEDWTKLSLDCGGYGASSDGVEKLLTERGIYPELSDGRYLLFYLSPNMDLKRLEGLSAELKRALGDERVKGTYSERGDIPSPVRACGYLAAAKAESELLEPDRAIGRICARNAGISPPCVPVIVAGEIITEEAADALKRSAATYGLTDGKAKVVKN